MLRELHAELTARGGVLRIVGARGRVRDLLRADGMGERVGGLDRTLTVEALVASVAGDQLVIRPDRSRPPEV
jgi:hypothetical protein